MVRAKVKVYEIAEFQSGKYVANDTDGKVNKWQVCPGYRIKSQIVSGGSAENDMFQAVSGGTNFELVTVNQAARDAFKVNGEYYVDFTPADQV